MKNSSFDDDNIYWCMDWQLTDKIKLNDDEVRILRKERFRQNSFGCLLAPLFPIFFLAGIIFLSSSDSLQSKMSSYITIFLVLFIVASALLLLFSNNCFKRAEKSKNDSKDNEKLRFTGKITTNMKISYIFRYLIKKGIISADENISQTFELLASGRLWTVNECYVKGFYYLPITHTAAVPEISRIAAEWLEPIPNEPFKSGTRELTDIEIEEMRHLGRSQWKHIVLPAAFLTLWITPLMIYSIFWKEFSLEKSWFFILIAITVFVDKALVEGIITAVRIGKDIAFARVVILRGPLESEGKPVVIEKMGSEDGENMVELIEETDHTVEVLPVSKLLWTIDGKPGEWRKHDNTGEKKKKKKSK